MDESVTFELMFKMAARGCPAAKWLLSEKRRLVRNQDDQVRTNPLQILAHVV